MTIRTLLVTAALLAGVASYACADNAPAAFPFVLPWDDASKTITDVSVLSAPMERIPGPVRAKGEVGGSGGIYVLNHNTDNALMTLRYRLKDSTFEAAEEPFERYASLRHFLHRCVTRDLLTNAELDLLIQFNLNETNGEEFADSNGTSSNAVRQKLKRLFAKLRRLAS